MTTPTATEPPTWRRFVDAPPPNGLYWSRFEGEPREWSTIVEVEGNTFMLLGTDIRSDCTDTTREYFTQPILPPV
jgi:hypothetical protein